MVGIEIVVGEQPLKYITSHSAGVVAKPNCLPPSTSDTKQKKEHGTLLVFPKGQRYSAPFVTTDWLLLAPETSQKWLVGLNERGELQLTT